MRTLHLCSFVVTLVTIAASTRAEAQTTPEFKVVAGPRIVREKRIDQPVPEGFHRENAIDKGVLAAGLGLFAIGYGVSAIVSIPAWNQGGSVLLVPFAGPFLMMSNVKQDTSSCDPSKAMCGDQSHVAEFDAYLVLMGVTQIIGAGIFVTSLLARHSVLVRDTKTIIHDVHVTPIVGGRVTGIGLSGTF